MVSKKIRKKREKMAAILRKEPDWRYSERLAALIEKSLAPHARVEHDVKLPVIGLPGNTRQCDVVITYGEDTYKFISIVEVQKRKSKPEINTFDGWVQKMVDVGAHQLICISAKGYPKSIKNKVADRIGPRVRLLTLKELQEPTTSELVFHGNFIVRINPKFSFESIGKMILKCDTSQLKEKIDGYSFKLNTYDKLFGFNDFSEHLSLATLASLALTKLESSLIDKGQRVPNRYVIEFAFGSNEGSILWYYHLNVQRLMVHSLPVRIKVTAETMKIPLTYFSYSQEFLDGTLAWVASSKDSFNGVDFEVQIVFKRGKDGILQIASVQYHGSKHLILSFYSDEKSWKSDCEESLSMKDPERLPVLNLGTIELDASQDDLKEAWGFTYQE